MFLLISRIWVLPMFLLARRLTMVCEVAAIVDLMYALCGGIIVACLDCVRGLGTVGRASCETQAHW